MKGRVRDQNTYDLKKFISIIDFMSPPQVQNKRVYIIKGK